MLSCRFARSFTRALGAAIAGSWLLLLVMTIGWLSAEALIAGAMQCDAAQSCPWKATR